MLQRRRHFCRFTETARRTRTHDNCAFCEDQCRIFNEHRIRIGIKRRKGFDRNTGCLKRLHIGRMFGKHFCIIGGADINSPQAIDYRAARNANDRMIKRVNGFRLHQLVNAPGPGMAPGGHLPRMIMPSTSSFVTSPTRAVPTMRPFFMTATRSAKSNTS